MSWESYELRLDRKKANLALLYHFVIHLIYINSYIVSGDIGLGPSMMGWPNLYPYNEVIIYNTLGIGFDQTAIGSY